MSRLQWAPSARQRLLGSVEMVLEDLSDTTRQALTGLDVQELVRTVCVRLRSQQSRNKELRCRETFAKHAHERNRAARAHVH